MSKKKICFIAQFPPPMHGLSKAVDTLYNSELNGEPFEFEKVDITNNMKFISNLIKIAKSKADLFYFTISQTKAGNIRDLVVLKLLELQHKSCLIHLHGGYYRTLVDGKMKSWQKEANYKAISKIDGVIVLGPSLKWIFEGMIPSDKIYTVPNCVDDDFLLSDEEFSEKIKIVEEEEVHHVLWLSNFIRSKGYPVVLEMAKLEKERVDSGEKKRFHFDFAGKFFEDSEKEFFGNYIKDNMLDGYVTYHGIVLGKEKKNLLKECSFFALPTKYPNEGQPISILEAMGQGMVIITTDHAGISDIVKNDINGKVVCADLPRKKISDCMYKYCLGIEKNMLNICKKNIYTVKNFYTETLYIENMQNTIQDILKGKENLNEG